MKVAPKFNLKEFVSKDIYSEYGDKCIRLFDKRVFIIAQFARDRFGKSVIVNNWSYAKSGTIFNYRGFREDSFYIKNGVLRKSQSQHRYGRAIDWHVVGISPDEVRKDIIDNFDLWGKTGLTTIEMDVNWIHTDCRITNSDALFKVYP